MKAGENRTPIRVYLIDDQAMIRAGFKSLLAVDARFDVAGDSGDPRAAVEAVRGLRPDVVLLDVSMPGLSGIDAIPLLREAWPKVRIVMLTHHEGDSFVQQALEAGADGYLSKDSDPGELRIALEAVVRGDAFLSPKVAGGLLRRKSGAGFHSRLSALTPRERQVFQLLALGRSNKEVAKELGMTLGTAKKHRENLQRKLDCHSTAELALLAVQEGLIPAS
jgi:DNA-binding NarL/FixJ family response regulator